MRRSPRPSSSWSSTCRSGRPARRPTCRCAACSRRRFAARPDFKITAGRKFEWGKNEILVGEGALKQFAGLDVGTKLRWGQNEWTVVGTFSADGALWESELWTDARVLQPAYRRGNSFQTVLAQARVAGRPSTASRTP